MDIGDDAAPSQSSVTLSVYRDLSSSAATEAIKSAFFDYGDEHSPAGHRNPFYLLVSGGKGVILSEGSTWEGAATFWHCGAARSGGWASREWRSHLQQQQHQHLNNNNTSISKQHQQHQHLQHKNTSISNINNNNTKHLHLNNNTPASPTQQHQSSQHQHLNNTQQQHQHLQQQQHQHLNNNNTSISKQQHQHLNNNNTSIISNNNTSISNNNNHQESQHQQPNICPTTKQHQQSPTTTNTRIYPTATTATSPTTRTTHKNNTSKNNENNTTIKNYYQQQPWQTLSAALVFSERSGYEDPDFKATIDHVTNVTQNSEKTLSTKCIGCCISAVSDGAGLVHRSGSDTTTSTFWLGCCLYSALHPDEQRQCQAELATELTSAIVFINLYGHHRDPRYFPNPSEFKPSRFLDSDGRYQASQYLIPFGLGRRSCLGESLAKAEVFLLFASLLQKFNIELTDDCLKLGEDLLVGTDGIVRAPEPHQLRLVP
uniref:Cytochrome P450 n=1 Tax=Macrostomum lignano TaxID=282301 RepID=A0A1I8JRG4_9PLAT